jgi:predicted dehydrogenase
MSYQRDFERRLGVALVGAGLHSYRNLLPPLHYLPVRLQAVCDRDESRARSAAEEYGVPGYYADMATGYEAALYSEGNRVAID